MDEGERQKYLKDHYPEIATEKIQTIAAKSRDQLKTDREKYSGKRRQAVESLLKKMAEEEEKDQRNEDVSLARTRIRWFRLGVFVAVLGLLLAIVRWYTGASS